MKSVSTLILIEEELENKILEIKIILADYNRRLREEINPPIIIEEEETEEELMLRIKKSFEYFDPETI